MGGREVRPGTYGSAAGQERATALAAAQRRARQLISNAQANIDQALRAKAPRGQPDTQANKTSRAKGLRDARGDLSNAKKTAQTVKAIKNDQNVSAYQINQYMIQADKSTKTQRRQRQSSSRVASIVAARGGGKIAQQTELKRLGATKNAKGVYANPTKISATLKTNRVNVASGTAEKSFQRQQQPRRPTLVSARASALLSRTSTSSNKIRSSRPTSSRPTSRPTGRQVGPAGPTIKLFGTKNPFIRQ